MGEHVCSRTRRRILSAGAEHDVIAVREGVRALYSGQRSRRRISVHAHGRKVQAQQRLEALAFGGGEAHARRRSSGRRRRGPDCRSARGGRPSRRWDGRVTATVRLGVVATCTGVPAPAAGGRTLEPGRSGHEPATKAVRLRLMRVGVGAGPPTRRRAARAAAAARTTQRSGPAGVAPAPRAGRAPAPAGRRLAGDGVFRACALGAAMKEVGPSESDRVAAGDQPRDRGRLRRVPNRLELKLRSRREEWWA